MTTITDQTTINAIQVAYNNRQWQTAYSLVFDAITTVTTFQDTFSQNPGPCVDPAVWLWVAGARKVNANSGAFAGYIRNYTAEQYQLRTGTAIPGNSIQLASDSIAQRFIADMFGKLGSDPSANPAPLIFGSFDSLIVPDLNRIGSIDAAGAAAQIFIDTTKDRSANYSPWAGTLLFTRLN